MNEPEGRSSRNFERFREHRLKNRKIKSLSNKAPASLSLETMGNERIV